MSKFENDENIGNIKKVSILNTEKLKGEFYFISLLEQAYNCGLLSDIDVEKIQMSCLELLANKVDRYTNGESSSVKVELAESIMQSNFYTIGIYLKTFDIPEEALKTLQENKIFDIYNLGRKLIDTKLKTAKYFYNSVLKTIMKIDNYTYNSTIKDGISGFFKLYNHDFLAQEVHITADYPICNPISELVGIELIQKYLEAIKLENMFCNYFSDEIIHHLLCGYSDNYRGLIFNIFEQVLTKAIGCVLTQSQVLYLDISKEKIMKLQQDFKNKSMTDIEDIIYLSYIKLCEFLELSSSVLKDYIERALPNITLSIFHAVKIDKLSTVFIQLKYPENKEQVYVSFGEKMDNDLYAKIIEEILQCQFVSEKIAIIKSKINSLADLEDLLFDAELESVEISEVLKELTIDQIRAFAKRHPYKSLIEAIDLSDAEITLSKCLNDILVANK